MYESEGLVEKNTFGVHLTAIQGTLALAAVGVFHQRA